MGHPDERVLARRAGSGVSAPSPAGLVPIEAPPLPGWCDRFLAAPGAGAFFGSRLWFEAVLAGALAPGAAGLLAVAGAVLLPLARAPDGRLSSLTTPYSLAWGPLTAPGADAAALHEAGQAIARLLRSGPPVLLEALDPDDPALPPLLAGLRRGGLVALRFDHVGNWHEALPPGTRWDGYLAARPPALRTTIRRKLARCEREMAFEPLAAPGPALAAGIAAYEAVRAASWKPEEPFPDFDAALMRVAAAAGLLRLGLLRLKDGSPVAAQYWVLDRGGARATVLKLSHVEAHRAASPGTALTAMMIRRLLEEDGVRELDFGRGDDPYKQLWVGTRRQRIGLVLASPRTPGGLLAIARQAAGRLRRALAGRPAPAAEPVA
jgi:hypothetical protein